MATFGGKTGTSTAGYALSYGSTVNQTNRSLYHYTLKNVEIFACPADRGDSLNPTVKSAYEGWGNSYLVQWSGDSFGIAKVTGNLDLLLVIDTFDLVRFGFRFRKRG